MNLCAVSPITSPLTNAHSIEGRKCRNPCPLSNADDWPHYLDSRDVISTSSTCKRLNLTRLTP